MGVMGSRESSRLLQLPVRLRGIRLGQPVDVLLDTAGWRVLGFVVLCGDDAQRFLPYAAAEAHADEIVVGSALVLLDDVAFYRARAHSLRALLGGEVTTGDHGEGPLRDLVVRADGVVEHLVVGVDGRARRVAALGARVTPQHASAA
jgi:hypothetical protein